MKIKLFTHTDLDGIGCAVVGRIAFGDILDVEYCDYDNVNEKVKAFLESDNSEYKDVYITDISVNEEVAEMIERFISSKVLLLDHHDTAKWLNKYDWAFVNDYQDWINGREKSSGTNLFYCYLLQNTCFDGNDDLSDFVELVRQYDTWEWHTKYQNPQAKKLNDLLYIIGRERFTERFIKNSFPGFDSNEWLLLELEQEKIDKYIESKSKQVIEREIYGKKVGVVFAERYSSQLGNVLATINPHLDLIAIVNPSYSVSYRTVKEDVHLGEFAKVFGGGGHPKASGSPISDELKGQIIDIIFQPN